MLKPANQKKITCNGETKTISEWAETLGITYATLSHHVKNIGGIAAVKRFQQPQGIPDQAAQKPAQS